MKILILVQRHIFHLFDIVFISGKNHIAYDKKEDEKY